MQASRKPIEEIVAPDAHGPPPPSLAVTWSCWRQPRHYERVTAALNAADGGRQPQIPQPAESAQFDEAVYPAMSKARLKPPARPARKRPGDSIDRATHSQAGACPTSEAKHKPGPSCDEMIT